MTNCPICCDKMNSKQKIYITKCGHTFHTDCVCEWLKSNTSCPLCRQAEHIKYMIYHIKQNVNREYKFKKHLGIETEIVSFDDSTFINPQEQLLNQCPQGWIDIHHMRKESLGAVYILKDTEDNEVFVDYYLRQIIMFDVLDISEIRKREGYKTTYYTTKQPIMGSSLILPINETEKFVYERLNEWMYEMIKRCIEKNKCITYASSMNTFMLDFLTLTIQMKGVIDKKNFQTVSVASIFTAVKFFDNIELDKTYLVYMTAGATDLQSLNEMIEFQETLIPEINSLV